VQHPVVLTIERLSTTIHCGVGGRQILSFSVAVVLGLMSQFFRVRNGALEVLEGFL
jgi:hypothetical protein